MALQRRLRIVSWNVNGAGRSLAQPDTMRDLIEAVGRPDVLCLQEIALRPDDRDHVDTLRAALPGWTMELSLARDRYNARFRGGRTYGVATFVRAEPGQVSFAIPSWDLEGRVLVAALPGLAVVNVYAVNGTDRPYYDAAGERAGDRHQFKRWFQKQVFALVGELRRAGGGSGVVALGDWNVSLTAVDTHPRLRTEAPHSEHRAALHAHIAGTGMVDIYRARHSEAREYTWYARHRRGLDAARVDYALVTPDLVPRVTSADILAAPAAGPTSDHVPIALELAP